MAENRRPLILAGVGVALVAAVLLIRLLGGGGGGTDDSGLTAPPAPPSGLSGTTTTTGPQSQETFEVFTARNPFRPLVSITPGGGSTGSSGGTSGTGTSTGTGGTSTGGGGTSTPTTVNNTGSGGTAEPGTGQHVALLEIFTDQGQKTARVRVGSTVYTAKVGERFASNYQVTSLADRCGDFLFGDSPFSLCVGEEVVK
jgi:hypothetical protein